MTVTRKIAAIFDFNSVWNVYPNDNGVAVSSVERSAKVVPEPPTMAGLAFVVIGIAAARRKQTKASVKV